MGVRKPSASRKAQWRGQSRAANVRKHAKQQSTNSTGGGPSPLTETPLGEEGEPRAVFTREELAEMCKSSRRCVSEGDADAVRHMDDLFPVEKKKTGSPDAGDKQEPPSEETVPEGPYKPCVHEEERRVQVVDCVQPSVDDRTWWERAKDKLALFSALWCCGLESDVRDIRANDEVKRMVSADMTASLGLSTYRLGSVKVSRDEIHQVIDTHGMSKTASGTHRVVVVPAFISSCVVALRMKLGEGATDRSVPGNVELVKAETARLLREYNVRNKDAALHQKFIIKAFFDDDTHYRVTDARARMASKSRLIRWLLSQDEKPHFDC